jgi:hypothetical protein
MPINTVDVVTSAHSSIETVKNATCVVTCTNTGSFKTIDPTYSALLTYNQLESLLTNRFDDVNYYTLGNSTIVGA